MEDVVEGGYSPNIEKHSTVLMEHPRQRQIPIIVNKHRYRFSIPALATATVGASRRLSHANFVAAKRSERRQREA